MPRDVGAHAGDMPGRVGGGDHRLHGDSRESFCNQVEYLRRIGRGFGRFDHDDAIGLSHQHHVPGALDHVHVVRDLPKIFRIDRRTAIGAGQVAGFPDRVRRDGVAIDGWRCVLHEIGDDGRGVSVAVAQQVDLMRIHQAVRLPFVEQVVHGPDDAAQHHAAPTALARPSRPTCGHAAPLRADMSGRDFAGFTDATDAINPACAGNGTGQ